MAKTVFYCNDPTKQGCSWSGYRGELVCGDDDPDGEEVFDRCPNCDGQDFQEEDEDDEDEG